MVMEINCSVSLNSLIESSVGVKVRDPQLQISSELISELRKYFWSGFFKTYTKLSKVLGENCPVTPEPP